MIRVLVVDCLSEVALLPENEIPAGMRPAAEFVSDETLEQTESCPHCEELVIKMFAGDHVCEEDKRRAVAYR